MKFMPPRPGIEIGAEYMVHSFSGDGQTFLAPDYLVVEVALFPPKGANVTAGCGQFTLRIDGKAVLSPARAADGREFAAAPGVEPDARSARRRAGRSRRARRSAADPPYGGGPGRTPRRGASPTRLRKRTASPRAGEGGGVGGPDRPAGWRLRRSGQRLCVLPISGKGVEIKSVEPLYEDLTLKLK